VVPSGDQVMCAAWTQPRVLDSVDTEYRVTGEDTVAASASGQM
jgi:hypothetical protein